MLWQANPYSLPLFVSAGIALTVAVYVWRRRAAPGAATLALYQVAAAVWAGGEGVRWALAALPAQVAALDVVYVGVVIVPTAYFVFILQVTHHENWLNRWTWLLLLAAPLAELLLLWTDPWHHLFHTRLALVDAGDFRVLQWDRGPAYLGLALGYTYALSLTCLVVQVWSIFTARGPYRAQLVGMLGAGLIPLLGSFVTQAGVPAFRYLDLAPFAFTLTGLILAYTLRRHRLLDLIPVARGVLVENMSDGVIVLDLRGRIVDINPAALALLGRVARPLGEPAADVLAAWPALAAHAQTASEVELQMELATGADDAQWLDIRLTPLRRRSGRLTGQVVTLRDITARLLAERELHEANTLLRQQLDQIQDLQDQLREAALRDPLTGLFNRRYLEATAPREFARALRLGSPVSLVLIDLDHFKQINDTQGHAAGDEVLRRFARHLQALTRADDIVCRYGGEEFLVVLPGVPMQTTVERVQSWQAAGANAWLEVTFSAGVAAFPPHGEVLAQVIHAADLALYQAKAAGRNCVRLASLA